MTQPRDISKPEFACAVPSAVAEEMDTAMTAARMKLDVFILSALIRAGWDARTFKTLQAAEEFLISHGFRLVPQTCDWRCGHIDAGVYPIEGGCWGTTGYQVVFKLLEQTQDASLSALAANLGTIVAREPESLAPQSETSVQSHSARRGDARGEPGHEEPSDAAIDQAERRSPDTPEAVALSQADSADLLSKIESLEARLRELTDQMALADLRFSSLEAERHRRDQPSHG